MKLVILAATALAVLAPAAASPSLAADAAPSRGRDCFQLNQVRGQKVADDKTLYFRVGAGEVFRVDMAASCLSGARFSDPLVIKSTAGMSLICRPIDLDLGVLNLGGMKTHCHVDRISRLTPEETAALTDKQRP